MKKGWPCKQRPQSERKRVCVWERGSGCLPRLEMLDCWRGSLEDVAAIRGYVGSFRGKRTGFKTKDTASSRIRFSYTCSTLL